MYSFAIYFKVKFDDMLCFYYEYANLLQVPLDM